MAGRIGLAGGWVGEWVGEVNGEGGKGRGWCSPVAQGEQSSYQRVKRRMDGRIDGWQQGSGRRGQGLRCNRLRG